MALKHVLFVYVDRADKLYDMYTSSISSRSLVDSGFDLFCPDDVTFEPYRTKQVSFKLKCAMFSFGDVPLETAITDRSLLTPTAFYLFARSSISKTNFRLANNVGIIDSGYRGPIGAFFDAAPWSNEEYTMKEKQRLLQLCHPTLEPFHVVMVDSEVDLGSTERGANGFGSTGV